jgi:hypothetical protein
MMNPTWFLGNLIVLDVVSRGNVLIDVNQALDRASAWWDKHRRFQTGIKIVTDTTEFYQVDVGDVLMLKSGAYLVTSHGREGRFGLDDEVKPWVKFCIDLETEERKVIKLEFFERFEYKMGTVTYQCYRSPSKEARILELTHGRPEFMAGFPTTDDNGNTIRVIDFVKGPNLGDRIEQQNTEKHDVYFHKVLPGLLDRLRSSLSGLAFLHQHGEKHGDVRRDHLIVSPEGHFVWIDFDYNYRHGEHLAGMDLAGAGNILAYLVGGRDWTLQLIKRNHPDVLDRLTTADVNLVFSNRLMNLQKLFPYIPDSLNRILLHFSTGAEVFYDTINELLDDLERSRSDLE